MYEEVPGGNHQSLKQIELYDYNGRQEVYTNYKRLRAAVTRAWDTIADAEIRDLIRSTVRERCQAVIDANGLYTAF